MKEKGTETCIDLFGCNGNLLNDSIFLKNLIMKAVENSEFTMVAPMKMHKFEPQGVTGYALLSSSHIAIHTWPEFNFASIDIFACDSKTKVDIAINTILDGLKPKKAKSLSFNRGFICQKNQKFVNMNGLQAVPVENAI